MKKHAGQDLFSRVRDKDVRVRACVRVCSGVFFEMHCLLSLAASRLGVCDHGGGGRAELGGAVSDGGHTRVYFT